MKENQFISGRAFSLFLMIGVLTLFSLRSFALEANDARVFLKGKTESVIADLEKNQQHYEQDPASLRKLVTEKISPHVDFVRMSRWILGKHWRKASKTQKREFVIAFRQLMVRTYSNALLKFTDQEIMYPPITAPVKKKKVTVKSEVNIDNGSKFVVSYRMHHKDTSWKVYDILVDGVSLIATYRSSLASEYRKKGMDGLIKSLESKNRS